jgi:hypothetical protein
VSELRTPSPKETFFKTPDLVTVGSSIIYPGSSSTIRVLVDSQTRSSVKNAINKDRVRVSIRSRFAQLGLDMHPQKIPAFAQQLAAADATVDFQLHNHALRPIHVPGDTQLLRLFYDPIEAVLTRNELAQAIGAGEIQLGGARGTDWEWAYDDLGKRMGVFVRISNSNSRRWIPPGEEVVSISSGDQDYRSKIDSILEPLPEDGRRALWVGETAIKITLGRSIEGILDTRVIHSIDNPSLDSIGMQTNSLLIDSGTKWPVRVEVVSSTDPNLIPNYVRFHFVRNGSTSSRIK